MIRSPKRIRFSFNKLRGDNAHAKTWEELDALQQSSMLEGVHLKRDELPVVAFVECRDPVVITTQRIVWRTNDGSRSVDLDEVASVNAPERFERRKDEVRQLMIKTHEGQEHLLETQPGEQLFVLWNLLLSIIKRPRTGLGLGGSTTKP
jgi:hypothetical protein